MSPYSIPKSSHCALLLLCVLLCILLKDLGNTAERQKLGRNLDYDYFFLCKHKELFSLLIKLQLREKSLFKVLLV